MHTAQGKGFEIGFDPWSDGKEKFAPNQSKTRRLNAIVPKVRWGDNEGQKNFYRAHQLLLQGGKWWTKKSSTVLLQGGTGDGQRTKVHGLQSFSPCLPPSPPIFWAEWHFIGQSLQYRFSNSFFIVHHLCLIRRLFCLWDIYKESQCTAVQQRNQGRMCQVLWESVSEQLSCNWWAVWWTWWWHCARHVGRYSIGYTVLGATHMG